MVYENSKDGKRLSPKLERRERERENLITESNPLDGNEKRTTRKNSKTDKKRARTETDDARKADLFCLVLSHSAPSSPVSPITHRLATGKGEQGKIRESKSGTFVCTKQHRQQ